MEFLKDFCSLRHGDIADKGMFYLMVVMFLLVLAIPFLIIHDEMKMTDENCVKTTQSRENSHIQFIYGDKGQIISAYPVTTIEYLYTCDDYPRWR